MLNWHFLTLLALLGGASTTEIRTENVILHEPIPGSTISASVALVWGDAVTGCYLQTPDGETIQLRPENQNSREDIELRPTAMMTDCAIYIKDASSAHNGRWNIYSINRAADHTVYERDQPFDVIIQGTEIEHRNTFPKDSVTVAKGSDLYIRLEEPVPSPENCQLLAPRRTMEGLQHEVDERFLEYCGYVIKNVDSAIEGQWEIFSHSGVIYRALLEVSVEEVPESFKIEDLDLALGEPVDMLFGPEDAYYCRLQNPSGNTAFEVYSQCRMTFDEVMEEHAGTWTAHVGLPGRLTTEIVTYEVNVQNHKREGEDVVFPSVVHSGNTALLSCVLETKSEFQGCKFIDPSSRVMLVREGLGEGRFSYHGSPVRTDESGYHHIDCGLSILNPLSEDFGAWVCELDTADNIFYGHLSLNSESESIDEDLDHEDLDHEDLDHEDLDHEDIVLNPVTDYYLQSESLNTVAIAGDNVTLSCNIQTTIRYCYFRSSNGAIFSVSPGSSSGRFEYWGRGFEAGDCGMTLLTAVGDGGSWSCHVGPSDAISQPDLSASMTLVVRESPIVVRQARFPDYSMFLEGRLYISQTIDYCRFVRADGVGFNYLAVPHGYNAYTNLTTGVCQLHAPRPTRIDLSPWSVVMRVTGQTSEIVSGQSIFTATSTSSGWYTLYVILIVTGLMLILVSILMSNKKSRAWTATRATAVSNTVRHSMRRSFRRSFTRKLDGAPPSYNDAVATNAVNVEAALSSTSTDPVSVQPDTTLPTIEESTTAPPSASKQTPTDNIQP